ncbi:unnamed protein product [Ectocarpus sp. 12 AP-2014]
MSGERCVFECRHPLWGGSGRCIAAEDRGADDACECDAGFASRDSFGAPSCVPKQVLVSFYLSVAVVAAIACVLCLWHLVQHSYLSAAAKAARRSDSRRRLIASSSFSFLGTTIVFGVAAVCEGHAAIWDGGMFWVFMVMSMSPLPVVCGSITEIWLESVPSQQLVVAGSAMAKLKTYALERNLLAWGGWAGMGSTILVAGMSLIVDKRKLMSAVHLATGGVSVCMMFGFTTLAGVLTQEIKIAHTKAPQAWHAKARVRIRRQAGILVAAGGLCSAAVVVLELTNAGRSTPIIPYTVFMLLGIVGVISMVHFTKTAGARGVPSLRRLLGQTSAVGYPVVSSLGSMTNSFLSPRATKTFEAKCEDERQWAKKEDSPFTVESNRGALTKKVIPMVIELLE